MRPRNIVAVVLVIVSLIVVVPGLTRPLITIKATFFGQELFTDTRSILQSVKSLHESGNDFVAGLILFFSVLVPFVKALLLAVVAAMKPSLRRYQVFALVRGISKWAMADVFVVGVYIAYLSAKATDALDAELHEGFYWFVAYCLISLVAIQVARVLPGPAQSSPEGSSAAS
jgi:uncharacterized paraquat-inducible protein A